MAKFRQIWSLWPPPTKAPIIQGILFSKMGQPLPHFRLFSVFSSKQYNFYNKSMWSQAHQVYSAGIRTHDLSNMSLPLPLDQSFHHPMHFVLRWLKNEMMVASFMFTHSFIVIIIVQWRKQKFRARHKNFVRLHNYLLCTYNISEATSWPIAFLKWAIPVLFFRYFRTRVL